MYGYAMVHAAKAAGVIVRLGLKTFKICTLILFVLFLNVSAFANAEIPNFHKVSNDVYRGGRPSSEGLKQLKKLGIKTVINLQGGDPESFLFGPFAEWLEPGEDPANIAKERAEVKSLGMKFWHAPLNSFDAVKNHDAFLIDRTLEVMRKEGPIFIHCEFGRDRTGLLIALYRVKYEGWDPPDAYTEWTQFGHGWLLMLSEELDDYFYLRAYRIQAENISKQRME